MERNALILNGKIQLDLFTKLLTKHIIKGKGSKLESLIDCFPGFASVKTGSSQWLKVNDYGLNLFQLDGIRYEDKKDSQLAIHTDFYYDSLHFCEESDETTWVNKKAIYMSETLPKTDGTFEVYNTIKIPIFNSDGSRKFLVVFSQKEE